MRTFFALQGGSQLLFFFAEFRIDGAGCVVIVPKIFNTLHAADTGTDVGGLFFCLSDPFRFCQPGAAHADEIADAVLEQLFAVGRVFQFVFKDDRFRNAFFELTDGLKIFFIVGVGTGNDVFLIVVVADSAFIGVD